MNYASVIVTFNRKKILPQAIDSVLNQTVSPGKVIVVDNASTDGTDTLMKDKYNDNQKVEYIRPFDYPCTYPSLKYLDHQLMHYQLQSLY